MNLGYGRAPSTARSAATTPPLLIVGGSLLALGLVGVLFALQMDTSAETTLYYGTTSRVNHSGLMNDRLVYLAAAGVAAVVGTILVVANVKRA